MPAPLSKEAVTAVFEKAKPVYRAVIDRLGYLYSRYQDEKEYEDFKDYIEEIKKALAKATSDFVFVSAGKRPFGFVFKDKATGVKLRVSVSAYKATLAVV